ncbi:MAG TPA: hypothetical protein EYN66_07530 [Myxococcales bacterium]|nr:hypothetical protein [Myxococcales bacterium]
MNLVLSLCLMALTSLPTSPPEAELAHISYLTDHRNGDNALIKLSTHPNPRIRAMAVLALGQNEVEQTFEQVQKVLTVDISPNVRRMAAFAVGQMKHALSEAVLLKRLKSEKHPLVRQEIWRALGRCGTQKTLRAAENAEGPDHPVAITNAGLILKRLKRNPSTFKHLTTALKHSDPQVRSAVYYAYFRASKGALETPILQAAVSSLNAQNASERESAARALSRGVDGGVKLLSNALQSNILLPHQESAIVQGLAKTKGQAANQLLLGILSRSLAKTSSSKRIVHPKFHVALGAARALRRRSITALQKETIKSLLQLAGAHEKADPVWIQRRRKVLLCALWQVLNQSNECTKLDVASYSRDPKLLTLLATHKKPAVRMAALASLNGIKKGGEVLKNALQDSDLAVVGTAASLLAGSTIKVDKKVWLKAWERAFSAANLEVAGDLLRAMASLKLKGTEAVYQRALNSGQIALARLGAKGLKALHGKAPALPRTSLPQNAIFDVDKYRPTAKKLTAHIKTELGTIVIRLHTELAPRTVQSFVSLTRKKFYDGLNIHRVVTNFVVQGGDPRGDGWGGPGYSLRCENNPMPYRTGTLGMALAGKDTGGSQWFITHSPQPHLLGIYTVFGQVMSGQRIVDSLIVGDKILEITIR